MTTDQTSHQTNHQTTPEPKPIPNENTTSTPSRSPIKYILLSIISILFTCMIIFFGSKIYCCFIAKSELKLSRNTFINWRLIEANKKSFVPYKYIKESSYNPKEYNGKLQIYVKKAQATIEINDKKEKKVTKLGLFHDGNMFIFPRTPLYHFTLMTPFEEDHLLKFHAAFRSFFAKSDNNNVNKTLDGVLKRLLDENEQYGGDFINRMPEKFLIGKELPKAEMATFIIDSSKTVGLYDTVFIGLLKTGIFENVREFIIKTHDLLQASYINNKHISYNERNEATGEVYERTKTIVKYIYEENKYFYDMRPELDNKKKEQEKMKDINGQITEFYQRGGQALWYPNMSHFFSMLLFQFRYLTFDVKFQKVSDKPKDKKMIGNRDYRVLNAFSFIFSRVYPVTERNKIGFFQRFFRPNSSDLDEERLAWIQSDANDLWKVYNDRVLKLIRTDQVVNK
ncbi:hypothetical protein CDIK_1311 [Cucumispora dikerogammari]|nr:hypothetical protein CDIK_1311 [Cucumispora dikerogammari]